MLAAARGSERANGRHSLLLGTSSPEMGEAPKRASTWLFN